MVERHGKLWTNSVTRTYGASCAFNRDLPKKRFDWDIYSIMCSGFMTLKWHQLLNKSPASWEKSSILRVMITSKKTYDPKVRWWQQIPRPSQDKQNRVREFERWVVLIGVFIWEVRSE